jgi:DNA-binding winged helix-turn-helix (wHTH) protein
MNVRLGVLTFDSGRRQVIAANGESLHLTPKAFDLLALLISRAPCVVEKSEIHSRLWPGGFVTDATLVGLVKELRRTLRQPDGSSPIRTAHGVGYAITATMAGPEFQEAVPEHWLIDGERRVPLAPGENLVGRDPTSRVWLDAAGVSRRHARIIVHGHDAEIEDLESKNGTIVTGTQLTASALLRDGDDVRIGPVRLIYRRSESGMSTDTLLTGYVGAPANGREPRSQMKRSSSLPVS